MIKTYMATAAAALTLLAPPFALGDMGGATVGAAASTSVNAKDCSIEADASEDGACMWIGDTCADCDDHCIVNTNSSTLITKAEVSLMADRLCMYVAQAFQAADATESGICPTQTQIAAQSEVRTKLRTSYAGMQAEFDASAQADIYADLNEALKSDEALYTWFDNNCETITASGVIDGMTGQVCSNRNNATLPALLAHYQIKAACEVEAGVGDECSPGDTSAYLSEKCLTSWAEVLKVEASLAATAATNFETIHNACTGTENKTACLATELPEEQAAAREALDTMESDSEMLNSAGHVLVGIFAVLVSFACVLLHT